MPNMNGYYICHYDTHTPIVGPFQTASIAAQIISAVRWPQRFCTMSRYQLAKDGLFPKTKAGDREILALLCIALDMSAIALRPE